MKDYSITEIHKILNSQPIPIVDVSDFFLNRGHQVQIHMALDYLNHENVSGNKLRKLLYPLQSILDSGYQSISSYGGYFSNHLSAVAWVGHRFGIKTTGFINGEKPKFQGNTLRFLKKMNMNLIYLSRTEYKQRTEIYPDENHSKSNFHIPMGGKSADAVKGFESFVKKINEKSDACYHNWWISSGTGTSALAIARYIENHQLLSARGAVKDNNIFTLNNTNLLNLPSEVLSKISYMPDDHFGGIGKSNPNLIKLMIEFHQQTGIPLDPVYTGKLVYSFIEHLNTEGNKNSAPYLLIHSGGIQGIHGFNEMKKNSLPTTTNFDLLNGRIQFTV